jgi:tRNA pseudouridine38-40 synthase
MRLVVHGSSFMLHHIRHMIGAAVAVALGLLSPGMMHASLSTPTRLTLPRAPPHTLLLSDCAFHAFPQQTGGLKYSCALLPPTLHVP